MTADTRTESPFATVEEAIEDIRAGRFVVVVDDEDRENEGDLTIAAQFATPEAVNFMVTHARGLVCLCLTEERCDELGLRQMTDQNETPFGTAFTVTVEAREGVTTGISAHDRAHTIQVAVDPSSGPRDLVQPGHIFPLRARRGGVLQRSGQTEAAVDLARLAGVIPAGVVCEIMKDDGTMARVPDLIEYCATHELKMITVADLIEYRRRHEKLVERITSVSLPTAYGKFTAVAFRETLTGKHHVALVKGQVAGEEDVLVRVHSECLTGDVFHSLKCDCGEQLELALARIEQEGKGVLLYLAQEGRGIGLLNKLKAYELQEQGLDTVEANLRLGFAADQREYGIGSQILADLGLSTIRVLTNNPKKISGIAGFGLEVVAQEPIEVSRTARTGAISRRSARSSATSCTTRISASTRTSTTEPRRERARQLARGALARGSARRGGRGAGGRGRRRRGRCGRGRGGRGSGGRGRGGRSGGRRERACGRGAAGGGSSRPSRPSTPPGDFLVPDGYGVLEGKPQGGRRAVGIVVSRFNGAVTGKLLEGALAELESAGVAREAITVMPVPGAFELPIAAMALAKTRRYACIVALGCVIRGDTPHFDFVAGEAASGLQLAALETGVPVAFGVLTLEEADQADDRLEKGAEAVRTGLEMADVFAQLRAAAQR